jgi:hypothetical protein
MSDRSAKNYPQLFDYKILLHSVLDVLFENKDKDDACTSEHTVGSDDWSINDSLREGVLVRARKFWSKRTELSESVFPYNLDAIALVCFRFRKRKVTREGLEAARKRIDRGTGDDPELFDE